MNKSTTKLLVIVGIIFVAIASWYTMINDSVKMEKEYKNYLKVAREKAELEIYVDAFSNYNSALNMYDTLKIREEMADLYYRIEEYGSYVTTCERMIEKYPYETEGYERLAEYYYNDNQYSMCYDVIGAMSSRGITSKKIDKISETIKYAYKNMHITFTDVGEFYQGYCPVMVKEMLWGYVNTRGEIIISCKFDVAKNFSDAGKAAVIDDKERYVLIDTSGAIKHADGEKKKIEDCTLLISDKIAVKYDGKYHYCDTDFKELFGKYDYAGSFSSGVAAVNDDGKWYLIDESGKRIGKSEFEDIKMDDFGIAFRNDVAFAKKDGSYILINTQGEQIGKSKWDDADVFNAGQNLAAVEVDGKWGFVDSSGKMIIEPTYDTARSFSNGLAAVCDNGLWGYIDEEDKEVKIECTFTDVKDFTDNGTAFVVLHDRWTMIQLYRFE